MNIDLTQEMKLFVYGVKPALLVRRVRMTEKSVNFLISHYPSIGIPQISNSFLIFHNGKVMLDFMNDGGLYTYTDKHKEFGDELAIGFNNELIGAYLGYDPKACKWLYGEGLGKCDGLRVRVNYHGLSFVCDAKNIENTISWLKENRKIPNEIKTRATYMIGDRLVEIPE